MVSSDVGFCGVAALSALIEFWRALGQGMHLNYEMGYAGCQLLRRFQNLTLLTLWHGDPSYDAYVVTSSAASFLSCLQNLQTLVEPSLLQTYYCIRYILRSVSNESVLYFWWEYELPSIKYGQHDWTTEALRIQVHRVLSGCKCEYRNIGWRKDAWPVLDHPSIWGYRRDKGQTRQTCKMPSAP